MYIGAPGVNTIDDVCRIYKKKWNGGVPNANDYKLFEELQESANSIF
jgi:hypothetical protein